MNQKPTACDGCPFKGDGKGWVPDLIRPQSKLLVMAQNPGEDEEQGRRLVAYQGKQRVYEPCDPQPLVGPTGYELKTRYLPLAGFSEGEVSFGNVIRCRWKHTNEFPTGRAGRAMLEQAITHCQHAYWKPPEGLTTIVGMGNAAKWALTGLGTPLAGIEAWRGYLHPFNPPWRGLTVPQSLYTPSAKEVPVYLVTHLADIYRDPMVVFPNRADWRKLKRVMDKTWPLPVPEIHHLPQSWMWKGQVTFDTEYSIEQPHRMTRFSVCTDEDQLFVVEANAWDPQDKPDHPVHLTGQNLVTSWDLRHARQMGLEISRVDDTMLLHAVLYPSLAHDLDFLGSLYSPINRWKHLSVTHPVLYAGADAYVTKAIWSCLRQEATRDTHAWLTYEDEVRPLIEIIEARSSMVSGLQVNTEKAIVLRDQLEKEILDLQQTAMAIVGYPIKLGSNQQVAQHLYRVNQFRAPKTRAKKG